MKTDGKKLGLDNFTGGIYQLLETGVGGGESGGRGGRRRKIESWACL